MIPSDDVQGAFVPARDAASRLAVLRAVREAGLDRVVFHDVAPESVTGERWLSLLDGAAVYVLRDADGRLPGAAWILPLDGPRSRTGMAHFCVLDPARKDLLAARFLEAVRASGRFDALLGVTPAPYRHVLACLRRWGFAELARLPGACWMHRRQRAADGVLSLLNIRNMQQCEVL